MGFGLGWMSADPSDLMLFSLEKLLFQGVFHAERSDGATCAVSQCCVVHKGGSDINAN